jgi:hypothetical protein
MAVENSWKDAFAVEADIAPRLQARLLDFGNEPLNWIDPKLAKIMGRVTTGKGV